MYTIDTSVFVNAVEEHEIDHAFSRQFLRVVRARQVALILPTLVTVEVAGTISRLRDAVRAQRLVALLLRLQRATFVTLDPDLARYAVDLAATHRLRGADAVYAAVTQRYSSTLVSRDREHLTRLAGIVPVQHPADALAVLLTPPATS